MTKYYQPSGSFSPVSFLYFILSSIIIIPILALIYTYLVWYIPFIYINFFITIGLGVGVGMTMKYVVQLGKVRNPKLGLAFGFLGGLLALYFSWVVWLNLIINSAATGESSNIVEQLLTIAGNPEAVYELGKIINSTGTWGFGETAISGTFLTIIWLIESLIIMFFAVSGPYPSAKAPFCELDDKWFDEKKLLPFKVIINPQEIISKLESASPESFEALTLEYNSLTKSHSVFTLYSSPKGENFLSIENKLAKINDKGEVSFDDDMLVEYISLNSSLKEILLRKLTGESTED